MIPKIEIVKDYTTTTVKSKNEETVQLTSNQATDDFEIDRAIHRASANIHKMCLRGGGQFLIFEGPTAIDFAKRHVVAGIYANCYQTIKIDDGVHEDRITVSRRGECFKWKFKKPSKRAWPDLQIPELQTVFTNKQQPDYIQVIHLKH
jgi:hypothetical protein